MKKILEIVLLMLIGNVVYADNASCKKMDNQERIISKSGLEIK